MDERTLRLKVGLLLVLGAAGVLGLLALLGELGLAPGGRLEVDFGHTGNVVKHAPVKVAGVGVGRVEQVALDPARRDARGRPLPIRMTLSVSSAVRAALRTDAAVTVSTQGPLGEAYLELAPGTAAGALPEGQAIRGQDAPRLDVVSDRLARVLEALGEALDRDPEAVSRLLRGVSGLSATADGVLAENREALKGLVQDLAAAAADARRVSQAARAQLEPGGKAHAALDEAALVLRGVRQDWPELSRRAGTALGGLASVAGPLEDADGQRVKALIARYAEAGTHLESVSARADRILARLEAGQGSLGASLEDRQAFDDLKGLLADLKAHPWKLLWKE